MAIKARPQFFNSSPGKAVRLFCTWETKEDLMLILQSLADWAEHHINGADFDFPYRNVTLYFSIGKEQDAFQGHLIEAQARQTEAHE